MTRPHGYFLINHYTHKKGEVAGVGEGQFLRDAEKYSRRYGKENVSIQEGNAYGNWYGDIFVDVCVYLNKEYEGKVIEKLEDIKVIDQIGEDKFKIDNTVLKVVNGRVEKVDQGNIEKEVEKQIKDVANTHAAVFQSNFDEDMPKETDMVVSVFGDKIGVNGHESSSKPDTSDYNQIRQGELTYKEVAEWDFVLENTMEATGEDASTVADVMEDKFGDDSETYTEVTGAITLYEEK